MRLVEDGVFNTEALKFSVKRLNQLGYFKALEGGKDVDVEKTPNDDQQGRRQAEARGAEPQPADLRRRRVAVRRLLRPAVVPDGELPRPRREPHAVAAGRVARAELLAGVHRAVPVRPQHHRRRQRLPAPTSATSASSRSSRPARVLTFGLPAQRLHADVRQLQLRARARHRDQPTSTIDPAVLARNPFLRDSLLLGVGGERIISKVTPSLRLQHGRPADLPDDRQALHGVDRPGRPRRQHATSTSRWSKASGSCKQTSRLSLGMRAPGRVHPHVHRVEGAADLREAVPRRRVQRPRLRHPDDRPAGSGDRPRARRQQEPAVQRRGADHDRRPGAPDRCSTTPARCRRGRCCVGPPAVRARRRVAGDRWWCRARTST